MFAFTWKSLFDDKWFMMVLLVIYTFVCYLHLNEYNKAPLFDYPLIDGYENILEGSALAKNGIGTKGNVYFHAPLYTWVVAALYKLTVPHHAFVIIFQFGLHFLNAILLYCIGLTMFSKFTARLSMPAFLFYGPAFFYASQVMNPTLIIFLNLVLILYLLTHDTLIYVRCCVLGLLAGLCFIARPDISMFFIFMLIWMYAKLKLHPLLFLRKLGIVFLFFLIPLMLTGWMNYRKSQQFQLLPLNGYINLYLGNNPDYKNTIGIRPGELYYEIYHIPDNSRSLPNEPGKYAYLKEIWHFAITSPFKFIKCQAYKTYTLINGYELPETFDIYSQGEFSKVFSVMAFTSPYFSFPFGIILPLALCGLFFIRRNDKKYMIVMLYLAAYTLTLIVSWNSSSYRLPLAPFLIMMAVAFIESMFLNRVAVNLKRVATVCLLVIITNLPYDHFSKKINYNLEIFNLIRMMYMKP